LTTPTQDPRRELSGTVHGPSCGPAALVALLCLGCISLVAPNFGCAAAGAGAGSSTGQTVAAGSASNVAPVILGVTPSTERLQPLDVCRLTCEAEDEDGDSLTYVWTASQGDITGQGATADWSAPDTEGLYRISVKVDDGNGGTDEFSISLGVRNNGVPAIQSVSTFDEGVRPGSSVTISCSATDPDADEMTYTWSATYGEVQGEGASIVWIAPEKLGSYVVNVSVRDTYGAEARRDALISVTPSPTPRLGEFVVEAVDHDMLKFASGVWDTYFGLSSRIRCVVEEGDEPLVYVWTTDKGTLAAEGAVATWTAPEERGPATITVAVTDAHGNTNSGQVLMYVEDCTCVFK
jgi:hypothetical protein